MSTPRPPQDPKSPNGSLLFDNIGPNGWVVRITNGRPAGHYKHKFGGRPEGIEKSALPKCVNCQHPLHLFFQIDLNDLRFKPPTPLFPFLYILGCLNCDSYWSPLYYRLESGGAGIKILEQAEGDHFGEFPAFLPESGIAFEPLSKPWNAAQPKKHQVGGRALWIQDEQVPNCLICRRPMNFIAQVDTDDEVNIMFGDTGLLYAFLCQDCCVVATFMQCY